MTDHALAVIGTVTGVVGCLMSGFALYLNYRSHRKDRPVLHIKTTLSIASNNEIREPHYQLRTVLSNRGRRVIQIHRIYVERLDTFEKEELGQGLNRWTTFNLAIPEGCVALREFDQKVLETPLDDSFIDSLGSFGVLFVEDTSGKKHTATFSIPDPKTLKNFRD